MKKFLALALAVALAGCAQPKVIEGRKIHPYGIFNEDQRNPCISYHTSSGTVIWSIILVETVIVPFWGVGWDLYQPDGPAYPRPVECETGRVTVSSD